MDDDYLEAVLDLVDAIPPGRVMTYGTIAEVVRERLGRGGPRQVGTVLSRAGSGVPWWRVVNASGRPPAFKRAAALEVLRSEGCPLSDDGAVGDGVGSDGAVDDGRVDDGATAGPEARVVLRAALWWPGD